MKPFFLVTLFIMPLFLAGCGHPDQEAMRKYLSARAEIQKQPSDPVHAYLSAFDRGVVSAHTTEKGLLSLTESTLALGGLTAESEAILEELRTLHLERLSIFEGAMKDGVAAAGVLADNKMGAALAPVEFRERELLEMASRIGGGVDVPY